MRLQVGQTASEPSFLSSQTSSVYFHPTLLQHITMIAVKDQFRCDYTVSINGSLFWSLPLSFFSLESVFL
uniref:Uncharacterized protein n=1 Tax=Octopus bimaculoides TaxID=37653 RepID=A0A0L8H8P7_OCTBM